MSAKQQTNFHADFEITPTLAECAEAYSLVQYHKRLEESAPEIYGVPSFCTILWTRDDHISLIESSAQVPNGEEQFWFACIRPLGDVFTTMWFRASKSARGLFLNDFMARIADFKAAEAQRAAAVIHVEHTTCTTLATLKDVKAAVLAPVLSALRVWSDLYTAGDQAANAAWLHLSRETAKAKSIHDSGLRAADLPAAVVKSGPKTSRTGKPAKRGRPEGQTEKTRDKMIVTVALLKSGFPLKTALDIAKLSPNTWYHQPQEE